MQVKLKKQKIGSSTLGEQKNKNYDIFLGTLNYLTYYNFYITMKIKFIRRLFILGAIYKITNLVNNKVYIGKTIRNTKTRWQEHIQYSKLINRYDTPLYRAIRKYNIENFSFEILEDNIKSLEELNQKEKDYIIKYNSTSHESGYNVAFGGDGGRVSSKLTEQQVFKIIEILSDINNLQSFGEIGESFGVSGSVIRSINQGISWYQSNIEYPIRKYNVTGLTIDRETYTRIISDIQNTNLQLQDIANKYGLSESRMTAINQGKECYSKDSLYYQGIYTGDFPIRKPNRTITSKENYIYIFYDVLFTTNSIAKIGEKYGVKGNTIQYIITGKRRKELTKGFILPMRQHQEENKKIFLELYPKFIKE